LSTQLIFSERVRYMLSPVRLSLVHPTQAVEIFGNISMALGTLAIRQRPWMTLNGVMAVILRYFSEFSCTMLP